MCDLRDEGYDWEHWGVVEVNPAGTGFHAHLWERGDSFVPQRVLQRACQRRGLGIPDIRAWRPLPGRGAGYGLKVATAYGLKGEPAAVLDLNGGRFGGWTRGFFDGGYGVAWRAAMREHFAALSR